MDRNSGAFTCLLVPSSSISPIKHTIFSSIVLRVWQLWILYKFKINIYFQIAIFLNQFTEQFVCANFGILSPIESSDGISNNCGYFSITIRVKRIPTHTHNTHAQCAFILNTFLNGASNRIKDFNVIGHLQLNEHIAHHCRALFYHRVSLPLM